MSKIKSLGFDLNNPMNVTWTKDGLKWQGIDKDNPFYDPGHGRSILCRFKTPVDGIRAGCRVLITHQDKYGQNTVRLHIAGAPGPDGKPIGAWAPAPEHAPKDRNHTKEYIEFICGWLGVGPDDEIDVHDYRWMRPLVEAIIDFENPGHGHPYTDSQIVTALARAGVVDSKGRDMPTPANSRTMRGVAGQVVTGTLVTATGVAGAAESIGDVAGPLAGAVAGVRGLAESLGPWLPWIILAAGLGTLVFAVYIGWAKLSDRKRGLA